MKSAQPNKFEVSLDIEGNNLNVLDNAPIGWLNTTIKLTRSKLYNGLFRGESSINNFVTKAAYLLRMENYTKGVLGYVKHTIRRFVPSTWGYQDIFKGRIDFSTATDTRTSFNVNSISDDFTVQLNANDKTDYAIALDVPEAVQVELTPLALKETADLIFAPSPDFRSNAFFSMQVTNNHQQSVNPSVFFVGFLAQDNPPFDTSTPYAFYQARTNTTVRLKGSIRSVVTGGTSNIHFQYNIYKTGGTIVNTLYDITTRAAVEASFSWDFAVQLNVGEQLFFYIDNLTNGNSNTGVQMISGVMSLSYTTISPATMCKCLPAYYVFQQLLLNMNTNTDSGPNQPVPNKSNLLNLTWANLMITCSDSIKIALGSLFHAGDTLFPGTYKVISGSITYGQAYNTGDTFPYDPATLTFTGSGVVQKITSGFIGTVYNPGDSLQVGGTYLVGGNPGTYVVYNSIHYLVNTFFTYVLGQDTFTGSDDSSFVEQTGSAPQLITNFQDFWKTIYGLQGGNASMGIESGTVFIEDLVYTYRGSVTALNAGIVDKDITFQNASDMIPNTIKTGYKDRQYSQLNGYSEVNSEQNYKTSIVNPVKELDITCVYRADPYGIEEIRVSQNDTAASRSDNDIFLIYKKTAPETTVPFTYYHPLRTEGLASISGVDPSYYNWYLSPKQNLLRGGVYLASVYYNMKGRKISFSSALKNTGMVTVDLAGRRVAEHDDIQISNLPKPLFIPIYCTFKPGLPADAISMMDSMPYGGIGFTYNGAGYAMFADTISIDIGENTQQEFKGLLTTGSDITQLIH